MPSWFGLLLPNATPLCAKTTLPRVVTTVTGPGLGSWGPSLGGAETAFMREEWPG